jgi:hypothetical protein
MLFVDTLIFYRLNDRKKEIESEGLTPIRNGMEKFLLVTLSSEIAHPL